MVVELLARVSPGAEVWAYGSRVRGNAQPASDLDLVLRNAGNPAVECPGVAALKSAFVDSNLPIQVDVVDWARLPAGFQQEILRGYVVLQSLGKKPGGVATDVAAPPDVPQI
jgi:predicted nucleotidyltransferase